MGKTLKRPESLFSTLNYKVKRALKINKLVKNSEEYNEKNFTAGRQLFSGNKRARATNRAHNRQQENSTSVYLNDDESIVLTAAAVATQQQKMKAQLLIFNYCSESVCWSAEAKSIMHQIRNSSKRKRWTATKNNKDHKVQTHTYTRCSSLISFASTRKKMHVTMDEQNVLFWSKEPKKKRWNQNTQRPKNNKTKFAGKTKMNLWCEWCKQWEKCERVCSTWHINSRWQK